MIANRDQWIIDTIARDGAITAHGRSGVVTLPADYVHQHVELAYAQTSHASQGRTVDRSILLLDGPTDVRGIYVPMTRGRHHNDAYIVTNAEHTAVDLFANAVTQSWIDQPALARQAELAGHNPPRPGTLPPAELQTLFAQQEQLTATLGQLDQDLKFLPGEYERARRDVDVAKHHLTEATSELQDAFDTLGQYDRPLRRRGHQNEIQLTDIDHRLGDDRKLRSRTIRREQPPQTIDTLGARPNSAKPACAWDIAAGQLDQHTEAYGLGAGLDPVAGHSRQTGYEHSRGLALGAISRIAKTLAHRRDQTREIDSPYIGIER